MATATRRPVRRGPVPAYCPPTLGRPLPAAVPAPTHGPTAPAPNTARLTLAIGATCYTVRPIPSAWHSRAFALRKADGTVYHLGQDEHGPLCDCADATFRGRLCKHARALIAFGLLDAAPAGPDAGR